MSKKKSDSTPLISVTNTKPDLRKKEQPLVDLKITNPITYLKSWWKRVIGNEGIDFRFRIKPLTAIGITVIIATFGFGVGRIVLTLQKPYIQFVPTPEPMLAPTSNPWRETAFTGTLRYFGMEGRYYLITGSSEAIKLSIPDTVDLSDLIGGRIFATGSYNQETRILVVSDASNLEVLPNKVESVPVITLTPEPSPEPTDVVEETIDEASDGADVEIVND